MAQQERVAAHDFSSPGDEQPNFFELLRNCRRKDRYCFFHHPVDTTVVSDYLDVVTTPMDFTTMEAKIHRGSYKTVADFVADVILICDNCMLYNSPKTEYYHEAEALRNFAQQLIKEPTLEPVFKRRKRQINKPKSPSFSLYSEGGDLNLPSYINRRSRTKKADVLREWPCPVSGCKRSYGSRPALGHHINMKHGENAVNLRDQIRHIPVDEQADVRGYGGDSGDDDGDQEMMIVDTNSRNYLVDPMLINPNLVSVIPPEHSLSSRFSPSPGLEASNLEFKPSFEVQDANEEEDDFLKGDFVEDKSALEASESKPKTTRMSLRTKRRLRYKEYSSDEESEQRALTERNLRQTKRRSSRTKTTAFKIEEKQTQFVESPDNPQFPYTVIDRYTPVVDKSMIYAKLRTSKRGCCNGEHCDDLSKLGPFDIEKVAFKSLCPDRVAMIECSELCSCTKETCQNRAISLRKRKKLGKDVDKVATFGIDPYTRRNIFTVVPPDTPTDRVSYFIEAILLPSLNEYIPYHSGDGRFHHAEELDAKRRKLNPSPIDFPSANASSALSAPPMPSANSELIAPSGPNNTSTTTMLIDAEAQQLVLSTSESVGSNKRHSLTEDNGELPALEVDSSRSTQEFGVPPCRPPLLSPSSFSPQHPRPAAQSSPELTSGNHSSISEMQLPPSSSSSSSCPSSSSSSASSSSASSSSVSSSSFTSSSSSSQKTNSTFDASKGFLMTDVLKMILKRDNLCYEEDIRKITEYMLNQLIQMGENAAIEFHIYAKGLGIVCTDPAGFPANTFIIEYFGEVYPPWRWYEKQDAIKSLEKKRGIKDKVPDFYNIQLERHRDDEKGFDVLFVDPIRKGNFGSRLSHSCDPNCTTVVMAVDGNYVIAVIAVRDIKYGEELTFDYNSVTESEEEYRSAICLCGNRKCRGSFLYFSGSTTFQQVIKTKHTFLHRVGFVLRASTEAVTPEERAILHKAGLKQSVLEGLPEWAIKWTALIVNFIEYERKELPLELVAMPAVNGFKYTKEAAELEALGVHEVRLQNIAITMDKIKYFLRKNSRNNNKPLRLLGASEIVERLWNNASSLVQSFLVVASDYESEQKELTPFRKLASKTLPEDEEGLKTLRRHLLYFRDVLRKIHPTPYAYHHAAADLFHYYANTSFFFTDNRFSGFKSIPFKLSDLGFGSGPEPNPKDYSAQYIWGMLVYWMKQTIEKPDASLSQNRRGACSLPSIQSCYSKKGCGPIHRNYGPQQRDDMLRMITERPHQYWPISWHWGFRNRKMYGSPMLDNVIEPNPGKFAKFVEEMRSWTPAFID